MNVARLSAVRTGHLYDPGNIPGTRVRVWGLCQRKIPKTPSGIEPVTSRLTAQCLNQLLHHVPPSHFLKIHFNIILPCTTMPSEWCLFLSLLLYPSLPSPIRATCSILVRMIRVLLTASVRSLTLSLHTRSQEVPTHWALCFKRTLCAKTSSSPAFFVLLFEVKQKAAGLCVWKENRTVLWSKFRRLKRCEWEREICFHKNPSDVFEVPVAQIHCSL